MLQDILNILESIGFFIEFVTETMVENLHMIFLAITYVVESVLYIFGITPLIPYNLVIVFMAMIVLSIVFLVFGRVK